MVESLINGFTANLYRNIHEMKRFNWSLEELLNIAPLDLSVFKRMIIEDINKDNK